MNTKDINGWLRTYNEEEVDEDLDNGELFEYLLEHELFYIPGIKAAMDEYYAGYGYD